MLKWIEYKYIIYNFLPYEMYKRGSLRITDFLVVLFERKWSAETVSKCWNESMVIILHKGGQKNKKELYNYRPKALMDTIGKIDTIGMFLNERMRKLF